MSGLYCQVWYTHPIVMCLAGGLLSFSAIFTETAPASIVHFCCSTHARHIVVVYMSGAILHYVLLVAAPLLLLVWLPHLSASDLSHYVL
eukprot:595622-Amphidinium_carterae.2